MDSILWTVITIAVVAALGFFVFVLVELRAAIRGLREFIKTTESSLKPTLEELQLTLKSLRNVTDNVTTVTDDVKVLSGSVRRVGEDVKHVSRLIDGVTSATVVKVSGIRAAVYAGLGVLVQNLLARRK